MTRILLLLAPLVLLALATPTLAQDTPPDEIIIAVPGIQPEGIEYDAANGRFLIGSLADGAIRQVADDGTVTTFIEDSDLVSSVGLQVDAERSRLLVASADAAVFADATATGKAALSAYDLNSGERLFYVDLAAVASDGVDFANDVAVDAEGNAYVTNTFTPVIYKVDPEGNAEVLIRDDRFASEFGGLNGIDYHPQGYLLAAVAGNEAMFKIPLADPEGLIEVNLSQPLSVDGMILDRNGTLFVVAYTPLENFMVIQQVIAVASFDDWASGGVETFVDTDGSATTVTLRDGVPYYIAAHLDNPQTAQYEIIRADLETNWAG